MRGLPRAAKGLVIHLSALLLAGCGFLQAGEQQEPTGPAPTIDVASTAFEDGAPIPRRFSCKGENISPPVQWSGVPDDARSLALVVDDPDAPSGAYIHWIVFNIDPEQSTIGAGEVPPGARQADNSNGQPSYTGPCPPSGTHHYRFVVYVLRSPLTVPAGADTDRLLNAVEAKVTAKGILTGTFAAR